jgi:murein DD-endopeptidase MepM/ murein hydrolase activator NlpD
VYACESGTVYKIETQKNGGNVIYLKHNDGIVSVYAHLKEFKVKKGDKVSLGDVIGIEGSSGNVTGEHLHFGLYSKGKNIYGNSDLDPFNYLELYDNQVVNTKTKNIYGSKIKNHSNYEVKYASGVDYEGLVVHSEASLSSKQVNILQAGSEVKCLSTMGNFTKIDENQFVYSKYLSKTKPAIYEVQTDLNVRSGAGTKYSIVKVLKKGSKVQIYKTTLSGWAKVSPSESRYVSKNYLKKV